MLRLGLVEYDIKGRNQVKRVVGEGTMKLISVNVALPRLASYGVQTVKTGIFKQPVSGPVQLRTLNLDGDRQADLTVHGGPFKAVYAISVGALRVLARGTAGNANAVGHVRRELHD